MTGTATQMKRADRYALHGLAELIHDRSGDDATAREHHVNRINGLPILHRGPRVDSRRPRRHHPILAIFPGLESPLHRLDRVLPSAEPVHPVAAARVGFHFTRRTAFASNEHNSTSDGCAVQVDNASTE